MKKISICTAILALTLAVVAGVPAEAQTRMFDVTVTNLTRAQIMSPPLVVTHSEDISLFELGEAASGEVAAIAEDAVYDDMLALLGGLSEVQDFAVGADVILPGSSMTVRVVGSRDAPVYSVMGMLVQTNDTFYAITKDLTIEETSHLALAYDAGSELNTESCDHIPGPPCDNPGVRVTEGAEGYVYVSPGIHGLEPLLPSDRYDWRAAVAKVSIVAVP